MDWSGDDSVAMAVRSGANLRGENLSYADLRGEDLYYANLGSANLSYANLRGANLSYADLGSANLSYSNLRGADLSGANLGSANLRGANLRYANLRGADLSYADLGSANLCGADLGSANLCGADLSGATGFRFSDAPDPAVLRIAVADQIESHPELHDQTEWGDGTADPSCRTPCCVAGWACHLGGGSRGTRVASAATRLLWIDGKPMPSFDENASREEILVALRA